MAGSDPVSTGKRAYIQYMRPYSEVGNLVVLESTSPVGTTEKISNWLAKARPDLTFPHTHGVKSNIRIAYCPERVLPGKILYELVHNDRIVGGMTSKCSDVTSKVYKLFATVLSRPD